MITAQVMQTTSGFHDQIIKALAQVAKDLMDDAKGLHAADAVFHPNAMSRNNGISRSLFRGQVTSFGLLSGLEGLNLRRRIIMTPRNQTGNSAKIR